MNISGRITVSSAYLVFRNFNKKVPIFGNQLCHVKKINNFWQPLLINWRPADTVLVAAILASFQLTHRFIVSSGLQYCFKVALLLIKKIQSKNIFINRKMISTFFLFLILIISSSLQFLIPFKICHQN